AEDRAETAGAGVGAPCAPQTATPLNAPPRLIGGEQKNPNLQGGEQPIEILESHQVEFEYFSQYVTDGKGRLIEIPLRRGREDGAFIDQITFTIHEESIPKVTQKAYVTDAEYLAKYSELLQEILGFGISAKLPYKGKFFYQSCYQLGPTNVEYGKVHYGGQRETILVELNGTGCTAAKPGWENRLYEFLQKCVRPKITRVDVAHDFFNGEYTPQHALTDHDNGFFDCHNVRPKSECKGVAWRHEDGSGKSFYIGKRGNAKYTRIYEKGKQLGDKSSPWVRFETEFRNGDIEVPIDILIHAGSYIGGAYPVCEQIFKCEAKRMDSTVKEVNLTFEHKQFYARQQVGKWVNFLKDIGWTAEDIVKDLTKGVEGYPKGLQPEEYDSSNACAFYIHEEQKAINALNIEVLELELNQEKQYEYPQDRQKQHERDYDKEQYQISDQLEDWKYL
ncbi:replication initiation factor domain-containing protein, partial [Neisseria meningitidis]